MKMRETVAKGGRLTSEDFAMSNVDSAFPLNDGTFRVGVVAGGRLWFIEKNGEATWVDGKAATAATSPAEHTLPSSKGETE